MLVAAAQLQSSQDPNENLAKARHAVAGAAERGAGVIVFPEVFMAWDTNDHGPDRMRATAQPLDGPFVAGLADAARDAGLWVIAGMIESGDDADPRPYNTTVVLDDDGRLVASYRKTHLFDAFGTLESATFRPGDRLFEPMPTPFGCLGLMVCYELRFPEVARHLVERGATVLVVPSAWVFGPLKELHWRSLVTTRAIENTCYVVAPGRVGNEFTGRSLIVDPMGIPLAEGTEAEAILYAEVDVERVNDVRGRVPSLAQRRPELYG